MMTAKARQLGMTSTVFRNASGLPDADQHTTARDMALLGMALRAALPQQFAYFSDSDFMFRGKLVRGHNDMLGRVRGVDGIKTGYIRASGLQHRHLRQRGRPQAGRRGDGRRDGQGRNDHVEDLINRYLPSASRVGGGTLLAAF